MYSAVLSNYFFFFLRIEFPPPLPFYMIFHFPLLGMTRFLYRCSRFGSSVMKLRRVIISFCCRCFPRGWGVDNSGRHHWQRQRDMDRVGCHAEFVQVTLNALNACCGVFVSVCVCAGGWVGGCVCEFVSVDECERETCKR